MSTRTVSRVVQPLTWGALERGAPRHDRGALVLASVFLTELIPTAKTCTGLGSLHDTGAEAACLCVCRYINLIARKVRVSVISVCAT